MSHLIKALIDWGQISPNAILFFTLCVLSLNVILYFVYLIIDYNFRQKSIRPYVYPQPTKIIELKNTSCKLVVELLNSGKTPALNCLIYSRISQNLNYPTNLIKQHLKYPPDKRASIFPNQPGVHIEKPFNPNIDPKLFTYERNKILKMIVDKQPEIYLHIYLEYCKKYAFQASFRLTNMKKIDSKIEYMAEMLHSSEERIR